MLVSHCLEVDPQWMDKYDPSAAPSGILWHATDFAMSSEVDPDTRETQPGSYDEFINLPMCLRCFMMFLQSLLNFGRV